MEIIKIKNYYKLCNDHILIRKNHFERINKPKISIITPVYNKEKYLVRFIRSVQNQYFNDIEIILVDDFSMDKSIKIIEKLKNEDDRIVLLKNKQNKGSLISRNIAGLKAKGEFLIFPDADDILASDILEKCYHAAKRYNLEFIRFHLYSNSNFVFSFIPDEIGNIINQPDLRVHLIYGLGYKKLIDGIISNKFISKELFVKCLNNIKKYLNKKMIYFEDGLINFSLYFNAKSLYLHRSIGYYYLRNSNSVSQNVNLNFYYECLFIFLLYVYENTKNTILEKSMPFYLMQEYIKNKVLKKITIYSKIYMEMIKIFSKSDFITPFFQSKIKRLKRIILKLFSENNSTRNSSYSVY